MLLGAVRVELLLHQVLLVGLQLHLLVQLVDLLELLLLLPLLLEDQHLELAELQLLLHLHLLVRRPLPPP